MVHSPCAQVQHCHFPQPRAPTRSCHVSMRQEPVGFLGWRQLPSAGTRQGKCSRRQKDKDRRAWEEQQNECQPSAVLGWGCLSCSRRKQHLKCVPVPQSSPTHGTTCVPARAWSSTTAIHLAAQAEARPSCRRSPELAGGRGTFLAPPLLDPRCSAPAAFPAARLGCSTLLPTSCPRILSQQTVAMHPLPPTGCSCLCSLWLPAAGPRATASRCLDSSLLSSELGGSSAIPSMGKTSPAPALGDSRITHSNAMESCSWPLLLIPANSSTQPFLLLWVLPAAPCWPAAKLCLAPSSSAQPWRLGMSAAHAGTWDTAQPNVHHGVSLMSQSNKMLRTVQGAPATLRAVRDSIRYLTLFRPPSRSTLNCS